MALIFIHIPDPRSRGCRALLFFQQQDQGSVLVHNTKTDLRRCDVLQPEVVPRTVIIKAHIPGAYLSYIILLTVMSR